MSITIITGVPGSGKSLYAVSKLLPQFIGTTVDKVGDDGTVTQIPRVVYTNINGLLLDHELVESKGDWVQSGKTWAYSGNDKGVRNWHAWAKPGALICFDEFQRAWPPRPNGSGVPPDISALDTHRHMGVDFILICQNLMNVDRHILGLCDRHLHVRRVANFGTALVYEWDHASKALAYKNAMSKSPWRYNKKAFALYKSAEVHTKQKRKVPTMLYVVVLAVLGAGGMWPYFISRINDRVHTVPVAMGAPGAAIPAGAASGPVVEHRDGMLITSQTVAVAPGPAASEVAAAGAGRPGDLAGCIVVGSRCGCVSASGVVVPYPADMCADRAGVRPGKPLALSSVPILGAAPALGPAPAVEVTFPVPSPAPRLAPWTYAAAY